MHPAAIPRKYVLASESGHAEKTGGIIHQIGYSAWTKSRLTNALGPWFFRLDLQKMPNDALNLASITPGALQLVNFRSPRLREEVVVDLSEASRYDVSISRGLVASHCWSWSGTDSEPPEFFGKDRRTVESRVVRTFSVYSQHAYSPAYWASLTASATSQPSFHTTL
jgi:hypothetical protein